MDMTRFAIIDSTLREGEQFAHAAFTTNDKLELARLLDAFGVEYLEVTSPCASPRSFQDCTAICNMGLNSKVLAHTRCHPDDVRQAADAGVAGVNLVIGTSSLLRRYSHGKSIEAIIELAREVIQQAQRFGLEVRFSTEDSMRSNINDLIRIYESVDALGVDRVGIADTVGVATPRDIAALVTELRPRIQADIEFHGHNDTGCAIANAHAALEAGATHIDTTVLGIGERNGITSLSGLIARLHALNPALTRRYRLPLLRKLDLLTARLTGMIIPFNHCITGETAFSHKAGIHTKAVLNHPATYEALNPEDFGVQRQIHIGHRLTGWNAVRHRAEALGLNLEETDLRSVTQQIKTLADQQDPAAETIDALLIDAAQRNQKEALHGANIS